MERDKIFYSKIDIFLVLFFAVFLFIIFKIFTLSDEVFSLKIGAILILLFTICCLFPCKYRFTKDKLIVKCGLLNYCKINYSQISDIRKSTTAEKLEKAPALSFDRITLVTDGYNVCGLPFTRANLVLSPKFKKEFIEELSHRIKKN